MSFFLVLTSLEISKNIFSNFFDKFECEFFFKLIEKLFIEDMFFFFTS